MSLGTSIDITHELTRAIKMGTRQFILENNMTNYITRGVA
jgi:ABC-type uncharacterized transport system ATPase component